MNILSRKLNSAAQRAHSCRWRVDPRFRDDPAIAIDRPIFLLGTQGGGLTLLARILRRHHAVVCTTGNHSYWAGADEMQNVLHNVLPASLTWREVRVPGIPSDNHGWTYASDALLPHYQLAGHEADDEVAMEFRALIRKCLRLHGARPGAPKRFIDKSQTFTLQVGYIAKLLTGCDPRFVLVMRNPYAMIWRSVTRVGGISSLPFRDEDKLEVAMQHWRNSYDTALACEHNVTMGIWRFEDILNEPERYMREICGFVDLAFDPKILPQSNDRVPFGSNFDAFGHKWYPIRKDASDRYIAEIPDWALARISDGCHALIERFGYKL